MEARVHVSIGAHSRFQLFCDDKLGYDDGPQQIHSAAHAGVGGDG